MWQQPFVSNWRPTSSNPILTQRTPWETGTRPLLIKIAPKNKQIAQVRFHFWARILVPILGTKCFLFYSNAPKNRSPKQEPEKGQKSAHWRQQFSGGLQRPLLDGAGNPTCPWRGIFHEHPWHITQQFALGILHSRPTAASSPWTASLSGSKNGARSWRREASSNSCLLCSSFHLESRRLAEFKHTSAIISGDPYYFFWYCGGLQTWLAKTAQIWSSKQAPRDACEL